MSLRVAILISGSGSNMVSLVESMTGDHPARPCVVLSNEYHAAGLAKARAMGVAAEVQDHRAFGPHRRAFEEVIDLKLRAYAPDIICLAGFMRILSGAFVDRWAGRMLNIHPSLLPKYPGLNTHARALEAGDTEAGCSVHEVTAELDAGPLLGQARVPVLPGDTPEALAARVLEMEHQLYPAVLRRFAEGKGTPVYMSQDAQED